MWLQAILDVSGRFRVTRRKWYGQKQLRKSSAPQQTKGTTNMMMLRRGSTVVLGLTEENVTELKAGRMMRVLGGLIGQPDVTIFILHASSHEHMREELRRHGYLLDGNGGAHIEETEEGGGTPPQSPQA